MKRIWEISRKISSWYTVLILNILAIVSSLITWQIASKIPLFCLLINVILEQGRATNLIYVKGLETAGDIAFPVGSSIFTSRIFTVGVSALLCLVFNLGIYGAFIGAMLDECIRGIGFYIRWNKGKWRNINLLKGIKKENS